jgi:hypothetical protein
MRKSGTSLFCLSLLLAAAGVGASHAQQGQRGAPQAEPCYGLFCPPHPVEQPKARKRKAAKPAKRAKPAVKQAEEKKP